MSKILMIETSGVECSVALSLGGVVVDEIMTEKVAGAGINSAEHSRVLGEFVEDIASRNGGIASLDAVAVCSGPGSYTGLRIGLSLAKGLCFGSGAKLIMIDALRVLVDTFLMDAKLTPHTVLMPMIDARRMEVYTAEYSDTGELMGEIGAVVVDEEVVNEIAKTFKKVVIFGSGAAKVEGLMRDGGVAVKIADVRLRASGMCTAANRKFSTAEFSDIAYSEPEYVKEWQPQSTFQKKAKN